MQSGLRYEKMPLGDKLMMKAFAAMVTRKKDKSEYIGPLVSYVLTAPKSPGSQRRS